MDEISFVKFIYSSLIFVFSALYDRVRWTLSTLRVHDHVRDLDVDTRVYLVRARVHRTLVYDLVSKRKLGQNEGQFLLHNHLLHQRIK